MITISLCMIVKNEEDTIGDCLASVKEAVDEIIIVDTGSTDRTKEIVKQYTDKIYDFTWIDDFAAARNYSFSKAKKDYILWLDADDILLEKDRHALKKLKKTLSKDVDCVQFYYNYAFDAQGNPSLTFRRERLVKRSRNYQWVGFIHEFIDVKGKRQNAEIYVTHNRVHGAAERNLNIYKKKIEEGVVFSPRDQYYYGKELYYHHMTEEAIDALNKFLTMPGWVEDQIDAIYAIADCYEWKGQYKEARKMLYRCFEYEVPRAECLYRIGKMFQQEEQYKKAIYWYEMIFQTTRPAGEGFIFEEYWTWRPHLELCVCYYQLGELEKSKAHNEQAAEYAPDDPAVEYNRKYFESLK